MVNHDDHKPFLIRGYRRSDREGVRKLCCATGFLGEPIDPVYEDRELFADFLTTYYTDHEPESCFLLEVDGEIRGYLLGSRKPLRNQLYALYQNVWLFFRALTRYFRYNARSRRFIRWVLMYGWHEVPAQPRRVPHFHINLLPEARKVSTTRALMSAYLSYLYRSGEKRVCGQISHVREPPRRKNVRALRIQSFESGGDHKIQSVLSRVGLPQHGDQELGNRRPTFRLLTRPRVTRNRRAEPIWRAAPVQLTSPRMRIPAFVSKKRA